MPTDKKRINVTLPKAVDMVLQKVARRDGVPTATKATELLLFALELEEDLKWNELAEKRDTRGVSFISHKDAWL